MRNFPALIQCIMCFLYFFFFSCFVHISIHTCVEVAEDYAAMCYVYVDYLFVKGSKGRARKHKKRTEQKKKNLASWSTKRKDDWVQLDRVFLIFFLFSFLVHFPFVFLFHFGVIRLLSSFSSSLFLIWWFIQLSRHTSFIFFSFFFVF